MTTHTSQIQLKLSLSEKLNQLLQLKATKLGVPVTQYVKYLIMKEIDEESYPVFQASERTIRNAKEALKNIKKAKVVTDVSSFFDEL